MTFSFANLSKVSFAPDDETERLNSEFVKRLGMPYRYDPARLAIARSLAVPAQPPSANKKNSKTIKCDSMFGVAEDRAVWISAIVEHAGDVNMDNARLSGLVSAHWRRGIKLLDDEWHKADQDVAQFIKRLVDIADIPSDSPSNVSGVVGGTQGEFSVTTGKISVPIGEVSKDTTTQEKITWELNASAGSPHSAIMGGVGSGKTRTAVAMLRSIREQAPSVPFVAFDFKGDLVGDGSYEMDRLFGASTVSPPREPVPLDVLTIQSTDDIDINTAALRFREAFIAIKSDRLGSKQQDAILESVSRALKAHKPCEMQNILDALIDVYEEREMEQDGAVSTMREICRFPLFNPGLDLTNFFRQSWLINLPQDVPVDSRRIIVNLVLNALDRHINGLADAPLDSDGNRSLRVLCMIDEAHQILRGKLPALSNLVRMSRSKGGAVMLISQSPDDFSGEDDEFLNEMGLVAAFGTNAANSKHVRRIFGQGANLSALRPFHCYLKRRGDSASRKVQSWPT